MSASESGGLESGIVNLGSVTEGSTMSNNQSERTVKRLLQSPNVLHGIVGTLEDKNNDYLCPICFEVINEAHITRCGHTFCYRCIANSLEASGRCPKCSFTLGQQDIFPNFLLNELVSKYRTRMKGYTDLGIGRTGHRSGGISGPDIDMMAPLSDGLRDFVAAESANLTLPDVNVMLEVLTQRKHLLEAESCATQNKLLHEFLKHLLQQKEEQRNQLVREVALIKSDMEEVENILKEVQSKCPRVEDLRKSSETDTAQVSAIKKEMIELIDIIDSSMVKTGELNPPTLTSNDKVVSGVAQKQNDSHTTSALALRRKRMHAHFDDFVQCYFESRAKELLFGQSQKALQQTEMSPGTSSGLDIFRENLVKFSRYNSLRPLATLNYSSDIFNNSTIVSSIEFDKDNEFFAIAGVTKRIKFQNIVRLMEFLSQRNVSFFRL
ncbi:E3 ubiquitin-protein ligase COP1-like isoform X3 [Athalia rosae]|uniref:E3 ubiquitin-protein ligase COP1-like isoform X3 n=1 Tax=Athalia rosae TaxID=37344 RepID=UPI0020338F3D|nr:E3 ubiquitin-protein ligase COP1-like isoform X3 [Athalia rosae]